MTVEEFMRAFPVQDFIPLEGNGLSVVEADNQTSNMGAKDADSGLPSLMPAETHTKDDENEILKSASEEDGIHIENQEVFEDRQRPQSEANAGGSTELLNSVLRLPTFGKDSFFQKKKPHSQLPGNGKTKLRSKPKKKATLFNEASESSLSFHQDEEYIVAYPNSTVTAIQVRYDGSAIARWPSGNVAVSVDFETSAERSGFRVYAAHKDGQLALSFDPVGVGFLNAYPSGKTLISTTSEGDGILFDASSGAILRQWDAQGHLRDGTGQVVDSLADEIDGSLLCRLSEYLAVRVQLVRTEPTQLESSSHVKQATALRRNLIALQIYFAGAPGIRHIFVNSANRAQPPDTDACACAFGKTSTTEGMARVVKAKPPLVEHADLLSSIRAAVAGL
ncbi:unnamed protein product [Phytophthora lilii]|uniref:Unnamed protein product n=1 Tax=Phytophthora lilii TaxID=2077276 RepID=A0A9W6TXJ7_9STRA|nr:unnamed protein product [Phytophthora lilii]